MNSISKNSPETALNTNPLYPDLTHQHLPSLYPTLDTLDTQDPEFETQQIIEQFIAYMKELVVLEYEHFNEKNITVKTRDIEKELLEVQAYTTRQQDQISYLESRIAEYKQREFPFLEAEGTDDSTREEKVGEVTELVNQINDLTSLTGIGEKSLHFELEAEQVSELQQVIDTLKNQIELQNNDIYHLQKENSHLNQNLKMGINHDTSSKTDDANAGNEASTSSKPTAGEQAMVSSLTQPIVKVLGELFSREDKKSIPPFKGKSTDKLITEWLKGAEHVARNNDWDDFQKLRFFSDRLKGEALEWHGEYSEEQGEKLNYGDWREAIIERFQDAFDLATLKKIIET
ncbi:hypothetical protein OUZ56_011766 [Daphnia magna]|uniref:Retrotransposon gag domain-containing protein n=1 Tax=Daphnia magna TaxID=35525 RepID=A0ABQ9Z1A9_9CRUS|nr:hypothetical protein OUZ56_011766 [Daphnia magna]